MIPPGQQVLPQGKLVVPPIPPVKPGLIPPLNQAHFKPEIAGKPDEDLEAHLLRTNDWMDRHAFQKGVKVKRFCLTLLDYDMNHSDL